MNSRTLPSPPAVGPAASAPTVPRKTLAIAQFLALEDCARCCEILAAGIVAEADQQELLLQLSECLAACAGFLAARSRESRYTAEQAALCHEVLHDTAMACRVSNHKAAPDCARACERARLAVSHSGRRADTSWN